MPRDYNISKSSTGTKKKREQYTQAVINRAINIKKMRRLRQFRNYQISKSLELSVDEINLQNEINSNLLSPIPEHKSALIRDSDPECSWYIKQLNQIPPIRSRQEEMQISMKAIQGDPEARKRLIYANLRFVVIFARKYKVYGLSFLDLVNEGNIGLIKALDKFDPTKNYSFISYAIWWVRQAIMLLINQRSSLIRLPINRRMTLRRINKSQEELEAKLHRSPTSHEIAEDLVADPSEIEKIHQLAFSYVPLDSLLEHSDNGSLSYKVAYKEIRNFATQANDNPEAIVFSNAIVEAIHELLEELTFTEREIIKHRYGIDGYPILSLARLGKKFCMSKESVRQIEKNTIDKLYKNTQANNLNIFLGY